MNFATDYVIAALMLINLAMLAASRLNHCISLVAIQGVFLGLLPLLSHSALTVRSVVLACAVVIIKGVIVPKFLSNAVRSADVRRELRPFLSYGNSLLIGVVIMAFSFWVGGRLPLPAAMSGDSMVIPGAICTIFIGLLLTISRKIAVTQVLGYLVIENGIAAFGLAVVPGIPLLIELGILLDVFVAVFVMAIIIGSISEEFDHIDTDRLSKLQG